VAEPSYAPLSTGEEQVETAGSDAKQLFTVDPVASLELL
jgi:hypothetical protein